MTNNSESSLLDDLKCPICLEFCDRPVESSCCHKLLCMHCVRSVQDEKCIFCRKPCSYAESVIAKRMIDSLPFQCTHCRYQMTRGNSKEHTAKCHKVPITCPACDATTERAKFVAHLSDAHNGELMRRMDSIIACCFATVEKNAACEKNTETSLKTTTTTATTTTMTTIDKQVNGRGNVARLGETGKYYCGGRLDGPACICCDGMCGLGNGCNCSCCMALDVSARRLETAKDWLVNRDGFNARKSLGRFYCGRKVMLDVPGCDGYCGPTNGPNCYACRMLDATQSRYNRWF